MPVFAKTGIYIFKSYKNKETLLTDKKSLLTVVYIKNYFLMT